MHTDADILEQIARYSNHNDSLDQIPSVSKLIDVAPTEWAYEALRSLVERYGCSVGYPDSTYRGNRALIRWECGAELNA
jgi:predicted RNase H-like nuclease (RuvC/YqgF family)